MAFTRSSVWVGLVGAVIGATGCHGDPPPPGAGANGVIQVDRCTVRLVDATPAERASLEARARDLLEGMTISKLELTPRGDRVQSFVVSNAPPPVAAPATPEQAISEVRALLSRYAPMFGALASQLATEPLHARPRATDQGPAGWAVDSDATAAGPPRIRVLLEPSGALLSVRTAATAGPEAPDGICPAPGLELEDPRVRRAVVGQTVRTGSAGENTYAFTDADIGAIETAVVQPEPGVFRRVIAVQLQGHMWTAWLDADTAALVRVQANFAN